MNFKTVDTHTIMTAVRSDGVRYLQVFLQEYTALFKETVNPGCPKCITTYLNRYKNHFEEMENPCAYRLHNRYENIPLEFGSPVLVNNSNITDEYASKLLEHKNGIRYFAQMPAVVEVALEPEPEQNMSSKAKRTRIKKKLPLPAHPMPVIDPEVEADDILDTTL